MEWIRKEANFKYFDKDNQYNNIIIRNEEDLVEEFYKYSNQFLCSGNIIIDNMINSYSNGVKDMWFFPLIYLYRQSLELILKANVFKYMINQSERKEYLRLVGHNLSYSFEILQMESDSLKELSNDSAIKWIIDFLNDITNIDKESDVFRYPFSNLVRNSLSEQKGLI